MARLLIRPQFGGETITISDVAWPYYQGQGYVLLETVDNSDDVGPLYLSRAESDARYAKIGDLGDPNSAEVQVLAQAVVDTPALQAAYATRPSGGTDGQALVKSGTNIVWGTAGLSAAQIAADPTVRAAYASREATRRAFLSHVPAGPAADPPLSTTVPTITQTGHTVTPPYANFLDRNTGSVRLTGGTYADQPGRDGTWKANIINDPGNKASTISAVEFDMTGTTVAVKFANESTTSTRIRTIVDGLPVNLDGNFPGAGTDGGGTYWHTLVFSTAARRRIRIEIINSFFGGVSYPAGTDISPPLVRQQRCAVYGDSWVGGANNVPLYQLLAYRIGTALNWDVANMGHGGSGYVADAAGTGSQPMADATRLARLATWAPEWAIILGSVNDDSQTAADVGAAATTVYSTLATSTPRTKLIVVGPQKLVTATPASRLANRDAIAAAAAAAPNVVAWVDPIAKDMITGSDAALISDGTHLTAEGHRVWTERLLNILLAA